jgi:hypothetical protein
MKTYIQKTLILLFFFGSSIAARAQSDSIASTIYFIRTKNLQHVPGNGVLVDLLQDSRSYNIFIDSQFICALNQFSFTSYEITPGDHELSVRLNSRKFNVKILQLAVKVEDRKKYYVEVVPGHTKLNSPLECSILSESIGSKLILDLKEDKKCKAEKNSSL